MNSVFFVLASVILKAMLKEENFSNPYVNSFLITHFRFQVPSKEEAVLVFGPVVPNGYGLCYNPQESQIIFGVSAFNCSPETDSNKMANSVRQSLIDMKNLMAGSVQAKL